MIALWPALIEMFFALHMHQVEFIHQTIALQQLQGSIHRDPVDAGIDLPRMAKNLRGIEMLFCGFNDAENRSPLMSEPKAARGQCRLQVTRRFGVRDWQINS